VCGLVGKDDLPKVDFKPHTRDHEPVGGMGRLLGVVIIENNIYSNKFCCSQYYLFLLVNNNSICMSCIVCMYTMNYI